MLKVKKLDPRAIVPTVTNPGEDLGFDLYALEDTLLVPGAPIKVRTGIAAVFEREIPVKFGLLIRDRSSMASNGITVSGGVVDAGYRDDISVIMTLMEGLHSYQIKAGNRIAQMIPISVQTGYPIVEVDELPESLRGKKGFGSSGR